jgi:hypothetical protein
VAEACGGESEVASEMSEGLTADVAQFDALEVAPDALVRVEVRRVAGELLQADAVGAALGQKVLDGLAAMDRRAIPDHQELAGDMAQQVLEEAHDIRALVGVVLHEHQQAALGGDPADDRQMVATEGQAEDRRLPARGVGPDGAREEVEARFVNPDDGSPLLVSPFFRAGQRSARHSSIAASLRWVARVIGFCTLHPAARRSLPT